MKEKGKNKMSRTVIGAYPNAFILEEARAYFKRLKNPKSKTVFDPTYEQSIRANFKSDEDFQKFVKESEEA